MIYVLIFYLGITLFLLYELHNSISLADDDENF